MKKAIVLLAMGFTFTYCNPSQQADQTTTDSSRMVDSTSRMSSTDTSGGSSTDTTSHPDSTRLPQ